MKKQIVVLGTGAEAEYHPLAAIESSLRTILEPLGSVTFRCDGEAVLLALDTWVDLLVLVQDDWKKPLADKPLAAMIAWVAKGGSILILHQGISYQLRSEFVALCGATFSGHPEAQVLAFEPVGNAIGKPGVIAWEMHDEPYRFDLDPLQPRELVLEYRDGDGTHPAGWERRFCAGKLGYLAPGHSAANFAHPAYAALVFTIAERVMAK